MRVPVLSACAEESREARRKRRQATEGRQRLTVATSLWYTRGKVVIKVKRWILSAIPEDVDEWVTERSKRLGISKSGIVKEAVEVYRRVMEAWEKLPQVNMAQEVLVMIQKLGREVEELKRRLERLEEG